MGIIIGAPFASGILATGVYAGAKNGYTPVDESISRSFHAIENICIKHQIPLKAAALQFPLGHKIVSSVIPGTMNPKQILENLQMMQHPIPDGFWQDLKTENLIHPEAPVPSNP